MTALRDDHLATGVCPATHRTAHHPVARTAAPSPSLTRVSGVDLVDAEEFVRRFHIETPSAGPVEPRWQQVRAEIESTGSYRHTRAELTFGARVAWRNNARCIGRLYWRSLTIRDLRTVRDADTVAAGCVEHLRLATSGGRIRPLITVFAPDEPTRPGPRIWNEQLIRYAGYRTEDGGLLGDPRYVGFTDTVTDLGWEPPRRPSAFDLLPLVVETAGDGPRLFYVPRSVVREVKLSHPTLPWFVELGLRWHAVPAISNMRLDIGGVSYPAAPFNGWYMGTEIGARNLADSDRYDMIGEVARRLGLDTSSERTLWRDQALVELNRAVLHSFTQAEVTITDHHTESRRFLTHLKREEEAGRRCPADWSWIVPPVSGGITPVFHRYYDEVRLKPEFVLDAEAGHRGQHGEPPCFPPPVRPAQPPRLRPVVLHLRRRIDLPVVATPFSGDQPGTSALVPGPG